VRELRRRVWAGDIGQPYYLRIQYDNWVGLRPDWQVGWKEKRELAGGGLLYDLGSHLFDIGRFALGPIESVAGFIHRVPRQRPHKRTNEMMDVETDDMAAAWFSFHNGIRGQWFISRVSPSLTDNGWLEVIGPEGALKASLSRGTIDRLKVSRPTKPDWEELPLPDEATDGKPHCLGIMMRSFVDACVRGRLDQVADASFHDGLAAQQGLAAVTAANNRANFVSLEQIC